MSLLLWITPVLATPLVFYMLPRKLKRWILLKTFLNDTQKPQSDITYEAAILPHSELKQISENLWIVSGTLPQPGPKFNRNMTIFRIPKTNKLVLHSVICLNQTVREVLDSLGKVSYIIVPSSMHRLDARHYQKMYPKAKVVCPEGARSKMNGWVDIDNSVENILDTSSDYMGIKWLRVDGATASDKKPIELVYLLDLEDAENSKALCCSDIFFNINPESADFVTKMIGSANGFGMTSIGMIMAEDPGRVQQWILKQFFENENKSDCNISCIIVGHGDVILGNEQVKHALTNAARKLSS